MAERAKHPPWNKKHSPAELPRIERTGPGCPPKPGVTYSVIRIPRRAYELAVQQRRRLLNEADDELRISLGRVFLKAMIEYDRNHPATCGGAK